MDRIPFDSIIPSFAPLILRDAAEEYATAPLLDGERRLDEAEHRQLVLAACFIGVETTAIVRGFERDRIHSILMDSMFALREYPMLDRRNAVMLSYYFASYPIIRDEHAFEDWICEALWERFQTIDYQFPSAMSGAIARGLRVMVALDKLELEIDENAERESLARLDQISGS